MTKSLPLSLVALRPSLGHGVWKNSSLFGEEHPYLKETETGWTTPYRERGGQWAVHSEKLLWQAPWCKSEIWGSNCVSGDSLLTLNTVLINSLIVVPPQQRGDYYLPGVVGGETELKYSELPQHAQDHRGRFRCQWDLSPEASFLSPVRMLTGAQPCSCHTNQCSAPPPLC